MKKNSLKNLIMIAVIVAFVAGGIYLIADRSATRTDAVAGTGGSPASPEDLIGKPVPQFALRDRNGTEYTADSLKGKRVVLFFNEGLMCYPACWNQMVALATDPRFSAADIAAFSVVVDQPSDWQGAIEKMPELGKAAVLYDTDKTVSRAFGMLEVASSMHYGSFPGHSFVIVDEQGIVRSVFDDPNMAIDNDRVFADLESLK